MVTGQTMEARRFEWLRHPLFWVLAPLLLLLLLIALVIGLYVVSHYLNEIKTDRQREAIGSFVAPTGWEEVLATGYSGEFGDSFCMAPVLFCNRHQTRSWTTTEPQSGTALRAVAEASGWKRIRFSAESHGRDSSHSCRRSTSDSRSCRAASR